MPITETPIPPGSLCQVRGCRAEATKHTLGDYFVCATHFRLYIAEPDWTTQVRLVPRPGQPHLRYKEPPYDEPWNR